MLWDISSNALLLLGILFSCFNMCLLTKIDGLTFTHISDVHFEQSMTPLGSNRFGVVFPSPIILWLVVAPTILWHEDFPIRWEGTKLEF